MTLVHKLNSIGIRNAIGKAVRMSGEVSSTLGLMRAKAQRPDDSRFRTVDGPQPEWSEREQREWETIRRALRTRTSGIPIRDLDSEGKRPPTSEVNVRDIAHLSDGEEVRFGIGPSWSPDAITQAEYERIMRIRLAQRFAY